MEKKDEDGGGVGAGGIGGIGGGGRKGKGKNVPNELKVEAEARRKLAQQDLPQVGEHTPRDFGDGSILIMDWSTSHHGLLNTIVSQIQAICWALVLGKILEFTYNMNLPIAQQKVLDIQSFVDKVKMKPNEVNAQKKRDTEDMAVGSLRKAMNHIYLKGIEKIDGRKKGGDKMFTVKGRFVEIQNATTEEIAKKVDKGLVGITIGVDADLLRLKGGIYRAPKAQVGVEKHALTIVGYGMTKTDELFFYVQNTWGTNWGVAGYGRIIVTETCDMFYLDEVISDKKKKEKTTA